MIRRRTTKHKTIGRKTSRWQGTGHRTTGRRTKVQQKSNKSLMNVEWKSTKVERMSDGPRSTAIVTMATLPLTTLQ